jgi:hypothetical protein
MTHCIDRDHEILAEDLIYAGVDITFFCVLDESLNFESRVYEPSPKVKTGQKPFPKPLQHWRTSMILWRYSVLLLVSALHAATHEAFPGISGKKEINSGSFCVLFRTHQPACQSSNRVQELARPLQRLRGGYDDDSKQHSGSYSFRHQEEAEEDMPSGEHELLPLLSNAPNMADRARRLEKKSKLTVHL